MIIIIDVFYTALFIPSKKGSNLTGGSIIVEPGREVEISFIGHLVFHSLSSSSVDRLDRPLLRCGTHLDDASATVQAPVRPPHLSSGPEKPPTEQASASPHTAVHLPLRTGAGGKKPRLGC